MQRFFFFCMFDPLQRAHAAPDKCSLSIRPTLFLSPHSPPDDFPPRPFAFVSCLCRSKVASNCVAAESKSFVLGLKQQVAQADVSVDKRRTAPHVKSWGIFLFVFFRPLILPCVCTFSSWYYISDGQAGVTQKGVSPSFFSCLCISFFFAPPSSCGACLHFRLEKGSAVPFSLVSNGGRCACVRVFFTMYSCTILSCRFHLWGSKKIIPGIS